MTRLPSILAALVLVASPLATGSAAFAKNAAPVARDPACKASKWTLALPAGSSDESATIVETPENKTWRVGVGGLPPSVMLVIEYKSTVGTKGELVLQSGAAQFVEGASVTMHLRRVGGEGGKAVAVAGTYQVKC
ncbi:hypothetical protein C3941_08345 [Kaistia algarum]|uniref:hypothetical protein n=1 Tax=Kaistia algarum TaxID=2083279 RepID=UPI000CE7D3A5|nr:hypothetical protein [Kaistia algarum]MCX5512063.1 hypothetical protein [Kaistia algarum]PPE80183.1 hypothetical protein C3941_08345 [Kaistia algarum]